jgi:ABC-type phosphate transport system substrate-binding protein
MKQLLFIIFCLTLWITGAFTQIAVIAHKSVPIDKIEKSELIDFYTGDKSFWSDGNPVIIFDLKLKGNTRNTFFSFLEMSPTRIKSIWMKRMLSGDADPPEFLDSEDIMIKKVASTPGSIGFIGQSKVKDDVKVILIIKQKLM